MASGTNTNSAVLVFCKAPVPGKVKTRLIGAMSAREAAEVHVACMQDTLAMATRVRGAKKWLYVAASRAAARGLAKRLRLARGWKVVTQRGADLGARMRNAIEEQLRAGAAKIVIVGTDSPWMGCERIDHALRLLDEVDIVLGPSEDGGYYLIGARRVVPQMFAGIRWGTSVVLEKTLRALHATRTKFRLLRRDFDLDRPEDLARVMRLAARGKLQATQLVRMARTLHKNRLEAGATKSSRHRGRGRRNKRRRTDRG